ncbi:MAG: DNA repair protein RecN [Ignavibacteriae bacterium]|nr:DNA repair protein RecN [Ignavibacteriota bacterium]
MLEKLLIKNYLIIKEAELHFSKGLNILTGETGAGKSIILDALGLILGYRADYSIIKNDNIKLVIEGHFDFSGHKSVLSFLKEKQLFTDDENKGYVIIRRELNKKGVSRNFINDTPVSTTELRELGDLIIDIHSQNEHQSLLRKETHCEFLDNFIKDDLLLNNYCKKYGDYKELITKYTALLLRKEELTEKKSYIDFQLKEINNVNPLLNEDEELEAELHKMENSEDISLSLVNSMNYLYENENNVLSWLSLSIKEIKRAVKYDNGLEKIINSLEENYLSLKNSTDEIRDYINSVNFDPQEIDKARNRVGQLTFLKKKYNLNVNELIQKSLDLTEQLKLSENFDFEIEKLKTEQLNKRKELFEVAEKLSKERIKASKALEKKVNSYFNEVGLESAEFKTGITPAVSLENDNFSFKKGTVVYKITSNGIDDVEFLIKANKGSEFTPLRKTASGGEISRIMLSLKATLSGKDNIPILVFDEIDAGISGRVAGKVGKLLSELAKHHQIISITHLPQIAAMSDTHYYVSKKDIDSETIAGIKSLNEEDIINEVARLLSGEKITEASKITARELREFKK